VLVTHRINSLISPDLILNVEKLETGMPTIETRRDVDIESGPSTSGPTIRLERAATVRSDDEKEEIKLVCNAKFDPKGKSVASGKNMSGWL
jgi:hypothetical protein